MSTASDRQAAAFRQADSAQPRKSAAPLIAIGLDCKPRLQMAVIAACRGGLVENWLATFRKLWFTTPQSREAMDAGYTQIKTSRLSKNLEEIAAKIK